MFANKLPPGMLQAACLGGAAGFFAAFALLALGWAMWTGRLRRNRYFGIRTSDAMRSDEAFAAVNGRGAAVGQFVVAGTGLALGAPTFFLCLPLPLLLAVLGFGALAFFMLRAGTTGPSAEADRPPEGLH